MCCYQGGYEALLGENDTGEGPARLFHDTQSAFSFHLLTECENLVISTVPQKVEQLGLMATHLSTIEMEDIVKNEWAHFAALFSQVCTLLLLLYFMYARPAAGRQDVPSTSEKFVLNRMA